MRGPGHHFERILDVWEVPGTPWATQGHPRAIRIHFLSILGSPGDPILESFLRGLGDLEALLEALGALLEALGCVLEPFFANVVILTRFLSHFGVPQEARNLENLKKTIGV